MRTWVRTLALLSGLRVQHCCELWCRSQTWLTDLLLLQLWCRPAPIWPLAWEPLYTMGATLKKGEKKKKEYWLSRKTTGFGSCFCIIMWNKDHEITVLKGPGLAHRRHLGISVPFSFPILTVTILRISLLWDLICKYPVPEKHDIEQHTKISFWLSMSPGKLFLINLI